MRKYPNGKLLIKPSKKSVTAFLDGIRKSIKAALGMSAADLIDWLNPKIRGWANYHRHVVSKRVFHRVDHAIFISLWQWARRRHQQKSPGWLKRKYFERQGHNNWRFFGEARDNDGNLRKVHLLLVSRTPIQRHVKVQSDANPYDPACETYFEKREGDHMAATFRGTQNTSLSLVFPTRALPRLRYPDHSNHGMASSSSRPPCDGGGPRVPRTASCSIQSATTGFTAKGISISPPRLPERGVQRAWSRMTGNRHVRFCERSRPPSNGGRLLGSPCASL